MAPLVRHLSATRQVPAPPPLASVFAAVPRPERPTRLLRLLEECQRASAHAARDAARTHGDPMAADAPLLWLLRVEALDHTRTPEADPVAAVVGAWNARAVRHALRAFAAYDRRGDMDWCSDSHAANHLLVRPALFRIPRSLASAWWAALRSHDIHRAVGAGGPAADEDVPVWAEDGVIGNAVLPHPVEPAAMEAVLAATRGTGHAFSTLHVGAARRSALRRMPRPSSAAGRAAADPMEVSISWSGPVGPMPGEDATTVSLRRPHLLAMLGRLVDRDEHPSVMADLLAEDPALAARELARLAVSGRAARLAAWSPADLEPWFADPHRALGLHDAAMAAVAHIGGPVRGGAPGPVRAVETRG